MTIGRTLSLNTKAFVKLKMENAVNDPEQKHPDVDFPGGGATRSLTLSAVNDTRDDLWNPATGHKLSSSLEYAGGILGGDNSFAKLRAEACQYYQVRDGHILAGRVSAGYGLDELPDDERFRLGERRLSGATSTVTSRAIAWLWQTRNTVSTLPKVCRVCCSAMRGRRGTPMAP